MLDVHAPGHKISEARDFFIHLLTITVGLLIALGLENAAEAMHHRHQRREAEENIRQELEHNRTLLRTKAPEVLAERDNLVMVMDVLVSRSNGAPFPDIKELKVGFHEENIPDAAWRTASSTGVLAYMDYGEVERFADAYKQQEMLQNAQEQALDDYLQLTPGFHGMSKELTPEQAKDMLPFARRALGHVNGMLAVGQGTMESYDAALK